MSDDLRAGLRVGEYVLEEPLGKGGFATVWRARHHMWDDRKVAAKILHDPEQGQLLRDEANCLSKLSHPGIVGALGMDLEHDPAYLIVELHEGTTLRDVLDRAGKLDPKRTYEIFSQLVGALAHSHRLGITHGDLKPENVLIDKDDRVKLTDFGLGQIKANEASLMLSGAFHTLEDDRLVGTLPYMAPEQREGRGADPATDVFALGIILHEMLSGARPQPGDDPREHLTNPPNWIDVWDGCYVRRDKRFKDAGEITEALGQQQQKRTARHEREQLKIEDPRGKRPSSRVVITPDALGRGPWSLDEIERAVCQETGVRLSELLAPPQAQDGFAKLIAWAETQLMGLDRQADQARRVVWFLATQYLDSPLPELAERYGLAVKDVQKGIQAVRYGQVDYSVWRGVVERLSTLPRSFVVRAKEREGTKTLRIAGASIAWAMAAALAVTAMGILAFGGPGSFLLAVALFGMVPLVALGGVKLLEKDSNRQEWIENNLAELPGEDRRSKLTHLAIHTELRALSKTAKRMLEREPEVSARPRLQHVSEEEPKISVRERGDEEPRPVIPPPRERTLEVVERAMGARETPAAAFEPPRARAPIEELVRPTGKLIGKPAEASPQRIPLDEAMRGRVEEEPDAEPETRRRRQDLESA